MYEMYETSLLLEEALVNAPEALNGFFSGPGNREHSINGIQLARKAPQVGA